MVFRVEVGRQIEGFRLHNERSSVQDVRWEEEDAAGRIKGVGYTKNGCRMEGVSVKCRG